MLRIWQVRPQSQGKGNDVRAGEGTSTETDTCAARGGPSLLRPAGPGCADWGGPRGKDRAFCAPVTQCPAREPGAGLRWGKGSENE